MFKKHLADIVGTIAFFVSEHPIGVALMILAVMLIFGAKRLKPIAKKLALIMVFLGIGTLFVAVLATLAVLEIVGLVIATGLALAAFVWFCYEVSKPEVQTQATTVPEEEFKYVMAGESLVKILPNLKDAGLDVNGKVTTIKSEIQPVYINPLFILMKMFFGIYWVSILYPLRRVYKYKIDKYRLVQESALPAGYEMKDLVSTELGVEVDSLRRYIPRPQFIAEVELKDGSIVNIVVMTEYEVQIPRIPIFNYKGKFFPLLDVAIEAAVNDFGNAVTYMQLTNNPTGKGSGFQTVLLGMIADHLEKTVGIRPTACYIVQVGLLAADQAMRDAVKARELRRLEGEGIVETAKAQSTAITTLATAHATTITIAVKALIDLRVDKNVAAQQVGRILAFREISGVASKIQTFVEAGGAATAAIPITPATATTSTP